MTKTLIDLDEDLLDRAQTSLGAKTKKEAVNGALRGLVRLAAVRTFLMSVTDGKAELTDGRLVLVDASALAHCARPEVAARLVPLLILDRLATCAAVEHEVAGLVDDGAARARLAALCQDVAQWLATDDADLRRATEIQAELTGDGQPPLAWSRLVTAAVAERYSASLLHHTSDFDLIAKITGQHTDWIVPEGSLA